MMTQCAPKLQLLSLAALDLPWADVLKGILRVWPRLLTELPELWL